MVNFKILGLQSYNTSWKYQKEWLKTALEQKKRAQAVTQEIILVEHPHVYTFGKHANPNHLLINENFLKQINAKTFQIERGGDITYHGPGQLVVYPLLDLEQQQMGIKNYIFSLEEVIIDLLQEYKVKGQRIDGRTGIWIDKDLPNERKIAAIGIKSSRYLTIHGLAFNVNTDLDYFNHIIPCGIQNKGVTSLAKELDTPIDFQTVIDQFKLYFKKHFRT